MQKEESGSEEGCQEVIAGALYLDWHVTFSGGTDMAGAQPSHLGVLASIHHCCRRLAGPVPGSASSALGRRGWKNANTTLSESFQLLLSSSPSPGRRAGTPPPRLPQAFSGPAESVISATIVIPSHALDFLIFKML